MPEAQVASKSTGRKHHAKKLYNMTKNVTLSSAVNMASKAYTLVTHLAGIINAERKFFDTTVNSNYTYNGAVNCISQVAGGDAYNQRNGNSVFCKGVFIRGSCGYNSTGTRTAQTIRVIVLIDKSPNPGTLTVGDVLQTIGTAQAPYAPMETLNRSRFKVLNSRMITMTSGDPAGLFKIYVPLKHHIYWNSSTATDYNKGHIYTVIVGDEATQGPNVQYVARINYYDN